MSEFDTPKDDYIPEKDSADSVDENEIVSDDKVLEDVADHQGNDEVLEIQEETEDYGYDEYDLASDDEDNDIDDGQPEQKSKFKLYVAKKIYEFNNLNRKKRITILSVFGFILLFIILVMTDIIPILPNSFHRSYVGNEYTLGETIGSDIKKCGEYVIYASEGSVKFFGPDMKVEKQISSFGGVPSISTSGDKAIVYCKNGNNALVIKNENDYKVIKVDENIYSAKINDDAGYVLLTSESGYKACVSAYSSSHKLIYDWHTNSNVIDVTMSNNENYIVASTIECSDVITGTKLVFMSTSSTKPVSEVVIDNTIVSEVFFANDNTLIAIGDTSAYGYTPKGIKKWEISYSGKNLKTYDYDSDGTLAFLFNKYNSDLSESTVELYDFSGKRQGVYESNKNVRSISVNNEYCLLLLDKETILLDDDGDVEKIKELDMDYQSVILYENYNFAFGLRENMSITLSVKH